MIRERVYEAPSFLDGKIPKPTDQQRRDASLVLSGLAPSHAALSEVLDMVGLS